MNKIFGKIAVWCLNLSLLLLIPAQVSAVEDFYTDNNTLKKILDNGMTVVIHEMHKTAIASVDIIVKAGSATEGSLSGSGISHLTEHMLFKESSENGTKSYNERMKSLGGDVNASTGHDFTAYTAIVPSQNIIEALEILKDLITSPYFDALELKKEKEVILDEIRKNKDSPARLALDVSWTLAFQEHPYKYPVIGYEDIFDRIGKKELEKYYSDRYSPDHMILVISGDIKKDELFENVEDIFGQLKRNFAPSLPNIIEPLQLKKRDRIEYKDISLAHVVLSYKTVSINDAALYPLDVVAIALGQGEDSILTKELRNKMKLVHYITCRNATLRASGLFYIYLTTDYEKVDDAIAAVLEELEKIKEDGISDSDLNKTKAIVKADLINGLETVEGRNRDISTNEAIAGDYNFSQSYSERISKVEEEDIKSAAKTYLRKEYLNAVRVLPERKREKEVASDLPRDFNRKLIKEDMPNGLRILVSEDHSTPILSISAVFLGGVRFENDRTNGVSHLVSKLLLDGTNERSEEDIKSEIESRGGSIQAFSGNNSFGVRINLLSEDWETGLDITSDIIMNSVLTFEKIEKEKTLALAAVKSRDDDIARKGILLFKQNFFEGHPYRLDPLGTIETIENLKQDDILNFYRSLCVPSNMVLTISGDIMQDEIIHEVKKRFDAFERKGQELPILKIAKGHKKEREISHTMKRNQSIILVGFPSVKLADNDRYVFEVIDSIMSGYNGRMYNNIRDKLGIGYLLGSSFRPGLEPGSYVLYALASRENIETIKGAILKEIKELKDKVVSEEELEAAQRYLITEFALNLQKNEAFGFQISLDELYGLGYKNFETYNAKIKSVTPALVKRVANQYFDMENCLIVIIYGEGEEET